MESKMLVPQKIKGRITMGSNTFHNSQKAEATQGPIDREWKQNVAYTLLPNIYNII